MAEAKRDSNQVTTLIAVSNADGITPVVLYADPTTHRLLVSATAGALDDLSDVTITSVAQGDLLYYNGSAWVNLAAGTSGRFLKTQGAGANPTWAVATAGAAGLDTQVQFNDGGTNIGGDAGFTYNKATDAVSANGGFLPMVNDTGALGTALLSFADLFLASGAVINFNNGNYTITHSAGLLTLNGAFSIGTANALTAGSIELGAASDTTITRSAAGIIAVEGVDQVNLSASQTLTNKTLTSPVINTGTIGTSLKPTADDGAPLGDTTHNFSDLFLATGAVINYANSNVVITHSSGILTVGTGDLRVTTAGSNAASVVTVGGTQTLTAKTLTSPVINTGTIGTSLVPTADDGAPLGDTTHNFSDLFLATGAVINYANSNVVITHSSGILTLGTGDFRVTTAGTNSASVVTVGGTQTLTAKTLTSPVLQTVPVIADGATVILTVPTVDGTATGDITNGFNCGFSSSAVGDLVILDSSATWQKTDANTASIYNGLIGIALEVKASGAALKVLLRGFAYMATAFPTFTVGGAVYMSETAGAVTQTAPVTTDAATRLLGYAIHADKMWFNPSNDWITHA